MSLRKTGLLWIALLLPVWGWASSVHTGATAGISLEKVQDRLDSRSQKRQDDKKKQKRSTQKSEAEQKQKPERVQRPDDRDPKESAGRRGEKPQIKEVPKSIHKLKPKSVTEKVRIRRPPVKVKPKGMFRVN